MLRDNYRELTIYIVHTVVHLYARKYHWYFSNGKYMYKNFHRLNFVYQSASIAEVPSALF